MTMNRFKAISVLFVVLLLVLAACGDSDDSSDFATTAAAMEDSAGDGGAAEPPQVRQGDDAAEEGTLGAGGVDGAVLQTASLGRDIIFTADMTVAVTDVAAAGAEATTIIQELGGFLFGQETRGAPEPYSVLTFKVLPGDFQQALSRLGTVGEIRTQNVSADDVTERVVDLESRISTSQASVERLKGFLEEASDIETIAQLEAQLLQRETDLETMRGQLRTLRDRVDLATIYLTLTEALSAPNIGLQVTGFAGHDDGISCPSDGRIRVEEGEPATVCFEIFNNGDTPLAGLTLTDTVLEVELSDLIVVWGDPNGVLDPGQSLVLAHEIKVERNLRTQTRVSAEPVDQDGNRVEGREVASTVTMSVEALDPGGLPGFQDALDASVEVFLFIGGLFVLAAGLLPLIILAGLLYLAWKWWQDRRPERAPAATTSPPWTAAQNETATEDKEPPAASPTEAGTDEAEEPAEGPKSDPTD